MVHLNCEKYNTVFLMICQGKNVNFSKKIKKFPERETPGKEYVL